MERSLENESKRIKDDNQSEIVYSSSVSKEVLEPSSIMISSTGMDLPESKSANPLPKSLLKILQNGCDNGLEAGLLNLSGRKINDKMIPAICEWIEKLSGKVKIIDLCGNKITSKGASILFDFLKKSTIQVSTLNLNFCELGDDCSVSLGELLQVYEPLEYLSINFNKFTDKGIDDLVSYAQGNITLKSIGLSSHPEITDISAPILLEFAEKTYLKELHVFDTGVSKEKILEIEKKLQVPVNERPISIKSKSKSAKKVE